MKALPRGAEADISPSSQLLIPVPSPFHPNYYRVGTTRRNDFRLEVDWVKALPGGAEAEFVLVSCVGAGLTGQTRRKMVAAKRCAALYIAPPEVTCSLCRPPASPRVSPGRRAARRSSASGARYIFWCFENPL